MARKNRPEMRLRAPGEMEPPEDAKNAWVEDGLKSLEVPKTKEKPTADPPAEKIAEVKKPRVAAAKTAAVKSSKPNDAPENTQHTGAGIIEYADGSFRRRTTIYLEPEAATRLRLLAAVQNRKVNDLIVDAVDAYLNAQNALTA